jgi:GT2 family glycosyltransferase
MADANTIFVLVLSYNGLEDTRKCLTSLEPALRPGVRPVLVDNGSTDGTADAVRREFPWCDVLRVEVNRGPVAGNNAGIRAALETGEPWIMLLNNDTTVDERLFDVMIAAAEANPGFEVLGPVIYFMDDPNVVMTDGVEFNLPGTRGFFDRIEVPLTQKQPPAAKDVDIVNGCCLMIRADAIRRIGFFDDRIFMYHDEADLCLRVKATGGRLGVIDHGLIWHKGSATSQGTGKKSIRYFDARNLWYLLGKRALAGVHGRGRLASRAVYFRYMYYWYDAELAAGNTAAAEAVVHGICDGLSGVSGPYDPARARPAVPVVRAALSGMKWLGDRRHALKAALSQPVTPLRDTRDK